jgi:pimeloyl-ACP methyl ester carboxylesterase
MISLLLFLIGAASCQDEALPLGGMVNDLFFLRNEGQDMPVRVSGNVDSGKMLLIIHGGPGGNGLEYRDEFVRSTVEKQVALVYWDQRYAGNSQGHGGSINIEVFADDIKKITLLLKHRYGQDQKIYLFAHSWGGFLAPYFLLQGNNQHLVEAWIQIGGAHNYELNDLLTKEMLLNYGHQELSANRNTEFWSEVVDWCTNNSHLGLENSAQLNAFAHDAETMFDFILESDLAFATPNNSSVAANMLNERMSGRLQIDQQAFAVPNSDNLNQIRLPTLLLWGKYDFVCPPELAEDIEANSGSADVSKVILERSGHSPMVNEPLIFWSQVLNWVKTR